MDSAHTQCTDTLQQQEVSDVIIVTDEFRSKDLEDRLANDHAAGSRSDAQAATHASESAPSSSSAADAAPLPGGPAPSSSISASSSFLPRVKSGVTFDERRFHVPSTPGALEGAYAIKGVTFALMVGLLLAPLPPYFYVLWFLFWRAAYNIGLGAILLTQSRQQLVTRLYTRVVSENKLVLGLARRLCISVMRSSPDYTFEAVPHEYNAWLVFRILVDVILWNDAASFLVFGLRFVELPDSFTLFFVGRLLIGILLCSITVWAKVDAYRVVGNYAWFWGDFFFLQEQKLVFDRAFALAPHPMYVLGYTWCYGASLIANSYAVFYVAVAAHLMQLAFLHVVEDPHIQRIYKSEVGNPTVPTKALETRGYLRSDLIVFRNLDLFRASDLLLIALLVYLIVLHFSPMPLWFHFLHVIAWRLLHSVGLGVVLFHQSATQAVTRHFLKRKNTPMDAWVQFRAIYNTTLIMTYAVFASLCIRLLPTAISSAYAESDLPFWAAKFVIGGLMILLNAWQSKSCYEALGEFGFFYGDFFVLEKDLRADVYYDGIYRYINQPELVLGFMAYYGMSLLCSSWGLFSLALFSQFCHYIFIRVVENPHMKKLYGNRVRAESGARMALKSIAEEALHSNPKLLRTTELISRRFEPVRRLEERFSDKVEHAMEALRVALLPPNRKHERRPSQEESEIMDKIRELTTQFIEHQEDEHEKTA